MTNVLKVGDRVNVETIIEGKRPGTSFRSMSNAIVKEIYVNGSAWIGTDHNTTYNGIYGGWLYFAAYKITKIQ